MTPRWRADRANRGPHTPRREFVPVASHRPPQGDGYRQLTPASVLSGYVAVAEAAGLNVGEMVRRVGLDPLCLTNRRLPLLAKRATELIELSAIEAGVSDFGLRMALAKGVPDIGPLNLLLREEPDLRSAIRSLQSHMHLHSRSVSLFLEQMPGPPILHVSLAPGAMDVTAPQATEMVNNSVVQTLRWLVGEDWSPESVAFSHAAPADVRPQRRAFRCDVQYRQSFDGLVLRQSDLDRRIAAPGSVLRQYAEDYLRLLARNTAAEFVDVVGQLIACLLPTGTCSSTTISRHLNMDRSTLGRRLAASGETYSAVLQRMRVQLATHYCANGWPLPEVADQLGFTSISVFSRWFRTSFGEAPSVWRQLNRSLPAGSSPTPAFESPPSR